MKNTKCTEAQSAFTFKQATYMSLREHKQLFSLGNDSLRKIAFRCDASLQMGSGHVMRCLTLAKKLRDLGAQCKFVCRLHDGNLVEKIVAEGFETLRLPLDRDHFPEVHGIVGDELIHADWLGTDWFTDARQTISVIENFSPDWLIVDHYGLDARWESALRQVVHKLMVIDDLFDRHHNADVLLNQNVSRGTKASYAGLIPPSCRQLIGPSYALLDASYRDLRERAPLRNGKIKRVLVYFGGIDAPNLTGLSLEALMELSNGTLHVDVVLPLTGPNRQAVLSLASRFSDVHVYDSLPTLAHLMAMADLSIGAAGATSWERLCLGLPSLVVSLSENQRLIAHALQINGLAIWLGHFDKLSKRQLTEAIRPLIQSGLPNEWSQKCRETVDGFGVDRVVAAMALRTNCSLTARLATIADEGLVADWPQRDFQSNPLDENGESRYRTILRTLEKQRLYLIEAKSGVVVGTVLAGDQSGGWRFHTNVAPAATGLISSNQLERAALAQLRADNTGLLTIVPAKVSKFASLHISICSDYDSWINEYIPDWTMRWGFEGHTISWAHDAAQLPESQVCFYLSYGRIVTKALRTRHANNLVVHESDLPTGRGWSPLTWQVLKGAKAVMVTLFEAEDAVDAGVIYGQTEISLRGDELVADLRRKQADATIDLCAEFISNYPEVLKKAREQSGPASYFPRRNPEDSRLDPDLPLREQFNLLRVCDNDRYPAWFEYAGARYTLRINRSTQDNEQT